MPPTDQASAAGSEVDVTLGPSEIQVDEDALSPRFQAQMEALLTPVAVLIAAAVVVRRVRAAGGPREP